jgi:ribonuclease P protein component
MPAAPRAASGWRSESGIVPAGARFPKQARLLRPDEFEAVFAAGGQAVAGRTAQFALHVLPTGSGNARLGLVIGKRYEKKSVRRNAIKRVLREAFRLGYASLPPADLVFRQTATVSEATRAGLKRSVREQADRLLASAIRRLAS